MEVNLSYICLLLFRMRSGNNLNIDGQYKCIDNKNTPYRELVITKTRQAFIRELIEPLS